MSSSGVPAAAPRPLYADGLGDGELAAIDAALGRTPNALERALVGVAWSEQCSRKSSRALLGTLPAEGALGGARRGNTGVITIGDGWAAALTFGPDTRRPAPEPGGDVANIVGAVMGDLLATGARPIAVLGALRRAANRAEDPLVSPLVVGFVREDAIVPAAAPEPGDLVILCGQSGGTGESGAGDAALVEATLEVVGSGLADGLSALGAAGIIDGVAEAAGDAGAGIRVDLDAIPGRSPGAAAEATLFASASARMVLTARPEHLSEIVTICARSGVRCNVIGRVTGDGDIAVVEGGLDATGDPNPGAREIARLPVRALAPEAVVVERLAAPPPRRRMAPAPGLREPAGEELPERGMDPGAVLLGLLGSPNLASRVRVNAPDARPTPGRTVVDGDREAAVLRMAGTRRALVVAMGGNAAVSATDPFLGATLSVAETARRISATGARPLAVTPCLAFGDPTRPEAFWQLGEAVRGLGEACRALALPVVGGTVSLVGDGSGPALAAVPKIAVLGLSDDAASLVEAAFDKTGDIALLAGSAGPGLAGSAYAGLAGLAADDEPPALDLAAERAVQAFIRDAIAARLVTSARGVAGGGLAVALGEMAIRGAVGGRFRVAVASEPAVALFGEGPSRVVLTVRSGDVAAVHSLADRCGVPLAELGTVGGTRLLVELVGEGATGAAEGRGAGIADALEVSLVDLRHAWQHGLPGALGVEA